MIAAYRHPDRTRGRDLMAQLIETVSHDVPTALSEITRLGRTLKRRTPTSWPTSTVPAPATDQTKRSNGRLEHLRGSAPGLRNLTNYVARSLLESGGFRSQLPPRL